MVGFWVVRIVRRGGRKILPGAFTGPPRDNDEDEDEDEDEDGVEVFTVSSRQCSRTGADLSPPPPSIPRYLVEPYRHAAAKMRGRACLPVTV